MRAYCIAPSFFSCEGRGTSRRIPPVTGNLDPSLTAGAAGVIEFADFKVEDDKDAAGMARTIEKGAAVLAVESQSKCGESFENCHTS